MFVHPRSVLKLQGHACIAIKSCIDMLTVEYSTVEVRDEISRGYTR